MTTEEPTKGRPLTIREERFAEGLIEGKSQKEAAIMAGYSPGSAAATASDKVRAPNFRQQLLARARERGIGVDFALDNVVKLMNQEQLTLGGRAKDQEYWSPDGATRAKGTDMLLKALGAYPDPRIDIQANIAASIVVRSADVLAVDPFAEGSVIEGEAREITGGTEVLPDAETTSDGRSTRHESDTYPA